MHPIYMDACMRGPVVSVELKQAWCMPTPHSSHLNVAGRWLPPPCPSACAPSRQRTQAARLLPLAIEQGVSFVPGVAFFATSPMHHALRLSFVTEPAERIAQGVVTLAQVVRRALATQSGQAQ